MGDVCTDTSAPAHYFPTCILVERFQEGNKKDKKSTAQPGVLYRQITLFQGPGEELEILFSSLQSVVSHRNSTSSTLLSQVATNLTANFKSTAPAPSRHHMTITHTFELFPQHNNQGYSTPGGSSHIHVNLNSSINKHTLAISPPSSYNKYT